MRKHLLASTIISKRPIIAFDTGPVPVMAPARPGQTNYMMIQQLMASAQAAADGVAPSTKEDLSARDIDSEFMLPYWDLVDDITTGYEAIKARADKYLPKFADEEQVDYDSRLALTKFTNIFRDICESLSGKPFEEEVSLVTEKNEETGDEIPLPPKITDFIENVDGAGNNLTSFAAATFYNGIVSAIDWIYVDYPVVDLNVIKTEQDMIDKGIRPFWSHVLGRNVLSVKVAIIGGKETRVYMRILEPGSPNHIRVFERSLDGKVICGLFEEKIDPNTKAKTFILIETTNISIGIIPLVPFATGRRDGRTFKFFPVMRDAADVQIQLYQDESALKFAKTMTGYPMLAANGMNPQKDATGKPKRLAVGANRVLYSERDGTSGNYGSWAYVSPDAQCLAFLRADLKATMDELRELGRQPLTAQSGNLTVITTAYAAGKSRTAVGAWALRLQDALENALQLTCMWLAINNFEPEVSIFSEYDDYATDQAADLTALAAARAAGDISRTNYIRELKRRNTLRPDFDNEENDRQLLEETMSDDETALDDGAVDPNAPPAPGKPKPAPSKKPAKNKKPTRRAAA